MFQPQLPDLPGDVQALLAPALAVVSWEARQGMLLVEGRKVDRAGKVATRANGPSYGPGFEEISLEVFGPAMLAEIRGLAPGSLRQPAPVLDDDEDERTCQCESCDGPNCQGDCSSCSGCCEQCNPTYSCCGCCPHCDYQHDYSDPDSHCVRDIGNLQYCRSCDHTCNNGEEM